MIRKLMVALYILLAMSVSSQAFAESANSSKALLDKLYDVRQLTKVGVSFEEYSKHVTELALALGRFERDKEGEKHSASDLAMKSATEYYILAKKDWAERLTVKGKLLKLRTELLQTDWELAENSINKIKLTDKKKQSE